MLCLGGQQRRQTYRSYGVVPTNVESAVASWVEATAFFACATSSFLPRNDAVAVAE